MKICWICHEKCSNSLKCKCKNEFAYSHTICLTKWIIESNKKKCNFCKSDYIIPIYISIWIYIINWVTNLKNFLNELCEYNLYTGIKWDDHF